MNWHDIRSIVKRELKKGIENGVWHMSTDVYFYLVRCEFIESVEVDHVKYKRFKGLPITTHPDKTDYIRLEKE